MSRSGAGAGGLLATYDLGERIGRGRLGSVVYQAARTARSGTRSRFGCCAATPSATGRARARFMREAQALQVAHPSIIQVRDYGEESGLRLSRHRLHRGQSLREVMDASGPMPWTRLAPLLAQLVEATRMLHRRKGLLCGVSPDHARDDR